MKDYSFWQKQNLTSYITLAPMWLGRVLRAVCKAIVVKGERNKVESKSAKYGFWGALIAAAITGAIGLYIHLDRKAEDKKVVEATKTAEQSKNTARLTISNIYVPPINTSIESAFFAQIQNNSLNIAKDVVVRLNFGESSVSKCETLPENQINEQESFGSSIITFSAGDIQRKDSLYIYCLTSHPVFDSILLTGPNLFSNTLFEFEQFESKVASDNSGFITFFKGVASFVAVIFIGYFTIIIIYVLNRKFGVDTSKY
ncbi:MAG: hypothetical protein MJK10_14950 [Pseudomonadales bacterium]|nr:hypothetical protein [Pseudomonadales bacterium]NRA17179.1 hypothetical protein [Oceanospirillaceae bacterium]